MLDQIKGEIGVDPYYKQNYANDGQRFVAWYLRRVLLRSPVEARQAVTDGADDKQIDAVLVDDDHQRVLVLQGKFIDAHMVDGEPLREVLSAWMRLKDLPSLQKDCNDRLKERLEAVRKALEDEYQVEFELLTTGSLTDAARDDLAAFSEQIAASADFPATLHLVDSEVLASRLAEAESQELPTIDHRIKLDAGKVMSADMLGTRWPFRCASASTSPVSPMGAFSARTCASSLVRTTRSTGTCATRYAASGCAISSFTTMGSPPSARSST